MTILRLLIVLTIGVVGLSQPASAHEVRPAYLRIQPTTSQPSSELESVAYEVLWKKTINEANRRLAPAFPDYCIESAKAIGQIVGTVIVQEYRLVCSRELVGGTVSIPGLELGVTEVMLHVTLRDGETISHLLKPSSSSIVLGQAGAPVWSYLLLGVEHLLLGVDHILFVVALLFFISRLGTLIQTITAFTLAHSFTLALSALDWVYLPQQPIEAVIALSILFLAVERLREAPEQPNPDSIVRNHTWVVAFAFGLLHGFGFAGALADIGLPKGNLIGALFLFNVGVEIGQLLVVAVGLGVAWIAHKVRLDVPQYIFRAPLYVVGSLAAFWVIERSVGIVV